jgi:hypothetical protein
MEAGKFYSLVSKLIILPILMVYFNSCVENKTYSKTIHITDAFFNGVVSVEKIKKLNKYKLTISNSITGGSDRIYTPYEIFQMNIGDVNHDGKTDICIGIIKPTPFDSLLKKRLFIFQIDSDYIRPLWLSSRLVYPMEEFIICDTNNTCTVKTIERKNKNIYCIHEYRWESFGMAFLKKHHDSLSYSKAQSLLNNIP